jgi:hypothetical protein
MLSLVSLVMITIAIALQLYSLVRYVIGAKNRNYEMLLNAQKLAGVATVILGFRAAINIAAFDSERASMAMITFITFAITYGIWKFLVIPMYEQYAVPEPVDQEAVEQQEIIDELNGQFLNPEKIIKNDR